MQQLKKALGFRTTVLLTINAVLGTELYFLPAIGASYAGPASIISWVVMAIIALFISFYFAELVSMFPKAGGTYEFMKQSFGEVPSFLVGWLSWIVANVTTAMIIVGSIYYILPEAPFYVTLGICLFFILLFNFINYIGIKQSARMLILFGIATVAPLIFVSLTGLAHIDPTNYFPFFVFPVSTIFLTTAIIAATFFGFEPTTFLAEEIKNARKMLPKAIILSAIFVIAISMAIVIVGFGVMNWQAFGESKAPLTDMMSAMLGNAAGQIFAIAVFISLVGTAASWVVSCPRLLFAMARDKVFISKIKDIHPKYGTPYKAIMFQAIITILITVIALGNYESLLAISIPTTVILYALIVLCVIKLRFSKPNKKRYFKAPLGKVGPAIIVIFFIAILLIWLQDPTALQAFLICVGLVLLGFPAYIIIKLQTDRKFIEKFFDYVGPFYNFFAFRLMLHPRHRKKVIENAKIKSNDIILDYGCASGSLTVECANIAQRVVAVDISHKQLIRALKRHRPNIVFIKLTKPAPFDREMFDGIISVLSLNYFINPTKELKKLRRCLKKGRTASFLSMIAPTITTHPFLKSNKEIGSVFKKAGFAKTKIERVKELGIEYIYITAKK